jgi:hypothetical protein
MEIFGAIGASILQTLLHLLVPSVILLLVVIPALYLGGPGFESQSGDQPYLLRFVVVFLTLYR